MTRPAAIAIPPSCGPLPRRCQAFPAPAYPPDWTLHVALVFPVGTRSVSGAPEVRHVSGRNVPLLNRYAETGQRRGATVSAWVDDPDDAPGPATTPATSEAA